MSIELTCGAATYSSETSKVSGHAAELCAMTPHRLHRTTVDVIAGQLLEVASQPLMLCDLDGTVLYANRAARQIVAEHDGLRLKTKRLVASGEHAAEALAIAWANAAASLAASTHTQIVLVPRPSGRPPYQLVLSALDRALAPAQTPVIVVLMFDPGARALFSAERLSFLYGLTRCEAEVAIAIAQGCDLAQIARESDRALGTVRALLKRAFGKTGTCRQAALSALLWHGAAGPLTTQRGR